jgi:predicted permease
VVLAFLGGILGMALAHAFLRALTQLVKLDLPVWMDATIEPRVVAFAMIASAIAGLAASAAPALRITRSENDEALRLAGGRTIGASRHSRLRRALMASELAVSVLLLVLSGLMVQTFVALWQTDLGFRARGLLTFKLALPVYYDEEATRQFQRQLLARLHALPAVTAATCNANLPLARVGQAERETLVLDGQSVADAAGNPYINFQRVCDRYFEVMQIPILRGRALGTTDRSGAVLAAVVSRRAADRLWPGRDPIGQRFRKVGPDAPWIHIVGIADDVRHAAIAAAPAFDIYLSAEQMTDGWMHFAVRTDSAPMSLVNDVRRAVHAINAEQPVGEFQPMEERAMDTAWQQRVAAFLLGVFSVMALVLAAIGIYGVAAYTVGQRTQEFGLRRALGAGSRDLVSTVLREIVGVAALGTASGLVAAAASVRVMKALLYETSPLDPVTFVAAPLTLMLVAILAATVPAVRAARIDPMSALRQ